MDSTLREHDSTTAREVSRAFAEGKVTKEALKLALEALEGYESCIDGYYADAVCPQIDKAITAIKEALAQPEQKPVAWMNDSTPSGIFARHIDGAKNFGCTIPLYTTPPQRTWVGLTNEERADCWETIPELAMKKVEAKLKEKNG